MSTVSEMTELQIPFSTIMYRVGCRELNAEMVQKHLRALLECPKGLSWSREIEPPKPPQLDQLASRVVSAKDVVRLHQLFTRVLKRVARGHIDTRSVKYHLEALAECNNNVWFSPYWTGSPLQQWDALWVMTADRD